MDVEGNNYPAKEMTKVFKSGQFKGIVSCFFWTHRNQSSITYVAMLLWSWYISPPPPFPLPTPTHVRARAHIRTGACTRTHIQKTQHRRQHVPSTGFPVILSTLFERHLECAIKKHIHWTSHFGYIIAYTRSFAFLPGYNFFRNNRYPCHAG